MGLGLLSIAVHDDHAVEHCGALPRDDAAIGLPAPAMRRLMLDQCMVVDVIIAGGLSLPPAIRKGDHGRAVVAVGILADVDAADLQSHILVHAHVTHLGVTTEVDLDN